MERSDIVRCEPVDLPYRGLLAKDLGKDVHGLVAAFRLHDGITGMLTFAACKDKLLKPPDIVNQLFIEGAKATLQLMPGLY